MTYRLLTGFMLLILSGAALADTPTNASTWQSKANSVCTQLNLAATAYQQHNLQQAHLNAVMAYFQNYDLTIEPAARKAFTQAHIFMIEQQFSALNKNMVDNPTPVQITQITTQATDLCTLVMQDAKTMDTEKTTPPVAEGN